MGRKLSLSRSYDILRDRCKRDDRPRSVQRFSNIYRNLVDMATTDHDIMSLVFAYYMLDEDDVSRIRFEPMLRRSKIIKKRGEVKRYVVEKLHCDILVERDFGRADLYEVESSPKEIKNYGRRLIGKIARYSNAEKPVGKKIFGDFSFVIPLEKEETFKKHEKIIDFFRTPSDARKEEMAKMLLKDYKKLYRKGEGPVVELEDIMSGHLDRLYGVDLDELKMKELDLF